MNSARKRLASATEEEICTEVGWTGNKRKNNVIIEMSKINPAQKKSLGQRILAGKLAST